MAREENPAWIIEAAPVAIADHLAQLHGLCFALLPESPWSAQAFRTILSLPTTRAFVVRHGGGEVSGLLVGQVASGEAELLTLCVAPGVRRGGVARELLTVFARSAGEQTKIVLEVAVDNRPAIALYESFGFAPVGRRPGYYAGREQRIDALIYARPAG